jgi:hypothetical protein
MNLAQRIILITGGFVLILIFAYSKPLSDESDLGKIKAHYVILTVAICAIWFAARKRKE